MQKIELPGITKALIAFSEFMQKLFTVNFGFNTNINNNL